MLIIRKYFPDLTQEQLVRFERMASIYRDLNKSINVISRKEMDSFCETHILHSLTIAKIISFNPGSRILDVGTGVGFPGIPLAILFPTSHFVLIDSIRNRIKVVQKVVQQLELKNVTAIKVRAEDFFEEFDFVASRAVKAFPAFVALVEKNISPIQQSLRPNGIIYLKGGDFLEEIRDFMPIIEVKDIAIFFSEPFFKTKKILYLPANKEYKKI